MWFFPGSRPGTHFSGSRLSTNLNKTAGIFTRPARGAALCALAAISLHRSLLICSGCVSRPGYPMVRSRGPRSPRLPRRPHRQPTRVTTARPQPRFLSDPHLPSSGNSSNRDFRRPEPLCASGPIIWCSRRIRRTFGSPSHLAGYQDAPSSTAPGTGATTAPSRSATPSDTATTRTCFLRKDRTGQGQGQGQGHTRRHRPYSTRSGNPGLRREAHQRKSFEIGSLQCLKRCLAREIYYLLNPGLQTITSNTRQRREQLPLRNASRSAVHVVGIPLRGHDSGLVPSMESIGYCDDCQSAPAGLYAKIRQSPSQSGLTPVMSKPSWCLRIDLLAVWLGALTPLFILPQSRNTFAYRCCRGNPTTTTIGSPRQ